MNYGHILAYPKDDHCSLTAYHHCYALAVYSFNLFHQQIRFFATLFAFPPGGALFRQVRWGLFFASLSLYVCMSPAILLNLGDPSAPLHSAVFVSKN